MIKILKAILRPSERIPWGLRCVICGKIIRDYADFCMCDLLCGSRGMEILYEDPDEDIPPF